MCGSSSPGKALQQHVMNLLHQQAHHRFNRTKIADRRANQDRERLSSQVRDVEVAAARRIVDELVVPSIERRDDMRLEGHALLLFAAYVLAKFVSDELIQIRLGDENIGHDGGETAARLIILSADFIVRCPRIVSLSST